jgi:hypothetical protein
MSTDVSSRGRNLTIVAWIAMPVILLGVLIALTLKLGGPSSPDKNKNAGESTEQRENPLATARSALEQQADLATCRDAVQQLNNFLGHSGKGSVPELSDDAARRLRELLGLSNDDLNEVAATTFTTLDAHHLEGCLLMRDAARSLEPEGGPVTLAQVEAAFAWVVRQVRLDGRGGVEPVPPAYVIRRGWGTDLERALVFLALLEQMGGPDAPAPQGALVTLSGETRQRAWACGVALADKADALYLFDPRLGLPLPGPAGKGVATLTQTCSDPKMLAQLNAVDKRRYDVTAKQAGAARVELVCALSALAPRMTVLQDQLLRDRQINNELLPEPVLVRLAQDPTAALAKLRAAVGKGVNAGVWPPGSGLLRHFLPKAEGGDDTGRRFPLVLLRGYTSDNDPSAPPYPRQVIYTLQLAAWQDFPERFRNPGVPYDSGLGQRLRATFAAPFVDLVVTPGAPRDLVLRGQFSKALSLLENERVRWDNGRDLRDAAGDLDKEVQSWVARASRAEAVWLRSRENPAARAEAEKQRKEVWNLNQPVFTLIGGACAEQMGAEVLYLQALARQEQAERLHAGLDRPSPEAGRQPAPADVERLKTLWSEAHDSWEEYQRWREAGWRKKAPDNTAKRPPDSGDVASRRLDARALAALGKTAEAVRLLRDLSGPMSDPEKLAHLYLARRLEKKMAGKGK